MAAIAAAEIVPSLASEAGMQVMVGNAHSKIMSLVTPRNISYLTLILTAIVCLIIFWIGYREIATTLAFGTGFGFGLHFFSTVKTVL